MRDAVALIRRKIDDPILAFQDATLDAVVTLAAIEVRSGLPVFPSYTESLPSMGKATSPNATCT